MTSQSAQDLGKVNFKINSKERYTIGDFNGTQTMSIRVPAIWTNGEVVQIEMVQILEELKGSLRLLKLILFAVTVVAMLPIMASSIALGAL